MCLHKERVELTGLVWYITAMALGHVTALVRSHMNGLQPFESTIEQTTETMPLALKQ